MVDNIDENETIVEGAAPDIDKPADGTSRSEFEKIGMSKLLDSLSEEDREKVIVNFNKKMKKIMSSINKKNGSKNQSTITPTDIKKRRNKIKNKIQKASRKANR